MSPIDQPPMTFYVAAGYDTRVGPLVALTTPDHSRPYTMQPDDARKIGGELIEAAQSATWMSAMIEVLREKGWSDSKTTWLVDAITSRISPPFAPDYPPEER